jgi:hypothetical protein
MNNIESYDMVAYKKYETYCRLNVQELREKGCDVDFQMISFETFRKKLNEDSEFAKVWGYWNFL